jgi:type VI secretion system secreted protein Hcp
MAVEMFLRIDGVTGGTLNYSHKGWADVLSYSWDLTRGPTNVGGGVQMNEISLVKAVGVDSAALMLLFAAGTPIKTAELSIIPTVGKRDAPQKYIGMTLEDVLITAISTGGGIDEQAFKEKVTLQFGKVKYEFHNYGEIGPSGATRVLTSFAFGWDLVAHTAH